MNKKQTLLAWVKSLLIAALAMVLLLIVHHLAVPTWGHMLLQFGVIVLTYTLLFRSEQRPKTAKRTDRTNRTLDYGSTQWLTDISGRPAEHQTWPTSTSAISLKGKSS